MKPVCLITGAAGKLGAALCRELASSYEIIAAYHSKVPAFPSQLKFRIAHPGQGRIQPNAAASIFCVQADLTRREDIRRLVEVSLAKFGKVDVIINSAADVKFHGKLLELWQDGGYCESQIHLNAIAPFQLVSAFHHSCWKDAPDENALWNRNVVNVSSMSGLYVYGNGGQGVYSASKAALNILTLHLSLELAPYSVRVNAICPGTFSDLASTVRVVRDIEPLLRGDSTGLVVGSSSESE